VSIRFKYTYVPSFRRRALHVPASLAICFFVLAAGCDRFNPPKIEMVYVSAGKVYLRDRVATVSNRVAEVVNGEPLQVLEHGRRFLRVKTGKNEIGWIEERSVIDARTYNAFAQLAADYKQEPVTAHATLRDDLYMHLVPGRDTEHFYLIPGNTKVDLLARASAVKASTATVAPLAKLAAPKEPLPGKTAKSAAHSAPAVPEPPESAPPAMPPTMEDWWLARDSQGHTGWLLGSRVDVDVPDEISAYGEGQLFVGVWEIDKVTDPKADTPDHQIIEYLTILAPPQSGLPFDFDQVRVFTWNRKFHRYETGFRLHPIQGFLPVRLFTQATPAGNVPAFSFLVASGGNVNRDSTTGITRPVNPRTIQYALIDSRFKRIGSDTASIPSFHEGDKKDKEEKAKAKKRK
jgi:hypothetical protein